MTQNSLANIGSYSSLSRAQLTVEYLHTNSTTHEFLFGALAELVDNARDAGATKMDIYSVPNNNVLGKCLLCFCDNGEGMDPTDVSNVIQFGRSTKRVMDSKMVGQYGNGLKSGSMRIGKDMILFTKKSGTMSCLFLSRTFHEREKINEVVVPIPSWDAQTRKPFAKSKRELEKHHVELQLILKYSPFQTQDEFFSYFNKIERNGTLVIIYNLKLLDSGETELEISDDDIKMRELYEDQIDDKSVMIERKSFRAYSAILYLDPRMRMFIQGKKVLTRRLGEGLYKPKSYNFTSKRFKTRSENEANKAIIEAKSAADKAREVENALKEFQEANQGISKEARAKLRQVQNNALNARTEADMKSKIAAAKQKSVKEPKTLTFTFGFNINQRRSYGLFIYNCNRLIKMYEKYGFQSESKKAYAGIIGFVDVPYLVLEPTHNKQDFADAKEYKHLLRSMADHLSQYWKDSGMRDNNVDKFWDNFGYISNDCEEEPSDEPKYVRKRAMQLPFCVQCANCLKWRVLPFSAKNIGKTVEDDWVCSMSTDPERNKCSAPEQKSSTLVGYLQKPVKSAEEKQKEIMEEIKKKQEKLGQLNGNARRNSWIEEKVEERPVKRVPPRSLSLPVMEHSSPPPSPPSPPVRSTARQPSQQPATRPHKPAPAKVQPSKPVPAKVTPAKTVPAKSVAKPTAKLAPIARPTSSRSQTLVSGSSVSGSNKREHPVLDKEVCEVQPKRKRNGVPSIQEIQEQEEISSDNSDILKNDESSGLPKLSKYKMNCKVDVNVASRWYSGKVVAVKHRKNAPAKVKVKFDDYQKDRYDRWFDENDDDLKLFNDEYPFTPDTDIPSPSRNLPSSTIVLGSPPAQVVDNYQSPTKITPMDTTPSNQKNSVDESVAHLDRMLRTCISYMLVPDYPKTPEQIQQMSLDELKKFPLETLFSVHSDSIKKVMEDRSQELSAQKLSEKEKELQESRRSEKENREKLTNLRRTAAKLIRSLNENPDESSVALNDDTDRVDTLLEAIAHQAAGELE